MVGTNSTKNVCQDKINVTEDNLADVDNIFFSYIIRQRYKVFDYSKYCQRPCTELQVTATLTGKADATRFPELYGIGLFFKELIYIHKH